MKYDIEKVAPRPWNLKFHRLVQDGVRMYWLKDTNATDAVSVGVLRHANAAHIVYCVNRYEEREELMAELVMKLEEAVCFRLDVDPAWKKNARALLAKVKG